MANNSARRQADVAKLMVSGFDVTLPDSAPPGANAVAKAAAFKCFSVVLKGPKDTPYSEGVFRVNVELPDNYPFSSPSIGFEKQSIWHPNVCYNSGSVCLDVLNSMWTPLYSLTNVMESFLPYLLGHPNPADPLNSEAAMMLSRDEKSYERRCRDCVAAYMLRTGRVLDKGAEEEEEEELVPAPATKERGVDGGGEQKPWAIDGPLLQSPFSPGGTHPDSDYREGSSTLSTSAEASQGRSSSASVEPGWRTSSSQQTSPPWTPSTGFGGQPFGLWPGSGGSSSGPSEASFRASFTAEAMDLGSEFGGEMGLTGADLLDDEDDEMDKEFD